MSSDAQEGPQSPLLPKQHPTELKTRARSGRIPPLRVTEAVVLDNCRYYTDVQLWPAHGKLNPTQWLANFKGDKEREVAVQVLNSFLYFPEDMVDQLLWASVANLSTHWLSGPTGKSLSPARIWEQMVDDTLFCHVTGEEPNPSDSGYLFMRKARQVLGISERQLTSPEDAIPSLRMGQVRQVVLLDDFVGSGHQVFVTWTRSYARHGGVSLASLAAQQDVRFFYCPLVCTQAGLETIEDQCPLLTVCPAHVLPRNYSLLAEDSVFWPDSMRGRARDVIRAVSLRAGIPDTDGKSPEDWQGYDKLGLALAFSHCIPDACLAFLYWDKNGWQPLMRRQ